MLLKWWHHFLSRGTLSQDKNLQTAKDAFLSSYHGKGFKYTNSSGVWNLNYSRQLIVWGIRREKGYFLPKKKQQTNQTQNPNNTTSSTLRILPNKVQWEKKSQLK